MQKKGSVQPMSSGPHSLYPPIASLGNGTLHRAIVSLPPRMTEPDRPLQERIVFFESPTGPSRSGEHLEKLLAAAWCVDTTGWCERGFIYNINTAAEQYSYAFGPESTGELRLFETGRGGEVGLAVVRDRIHYARAADVDLLVSPRVAARLHELSDIIEDLYAAEVGMANGVVK